jgi:hypothetical protein
MVLGMLSGQAASIRSADSLLQDVEEQTDGPHFPLEYLNALNFPGMPLYLLKLRVGAPIILLHTLNPANGLCNDTHILLTTIQPRVLKAKIVFGNHAGKEVLIPRIALDIAHQSLSFKLRWL